MTGRPTDYTEDKASLVLAMMTEGMSIKKICETPGLPDPRTIYRWLSANETFRQNYAKAQIDRATVFAEEILEISDDSSDDILVDGDRISPNSVSVSRDKLKVDTRKWLMSRLDPKRYGDKITQEHTGADGGPVQFVTIYDATPTKPGTS